jgi:DNA-binding transcriptional MerR regulator
VQSHSNRCRIAAVQGGHLEGTLSPTGDEVSLSRRQVGLVYSVGEAARLAGISPSAIRLYEKQGLLSLPRTAGGHRYLTEANFGTLKRIGVLRRVQRLPLEEIRQQLEQSPGTAHPEAVDQPDASRPGPRIRALRKSRGKTVRQIAQETGLSVSFLSSFERGSTGISVANLQKLVGACGSSLIEVFAELGQGDRQQVKPVDRPRLVLSRGAVVIEDLAVVPRQIEVQLWTIQPGASSEGAYSHVGEEAMFMISGHLTVWLNESKDYYLEPGDCLYFSSSDTHRWHNQHSEPAVILWVNNPPTF